MISTNSATAPTISATETNQADHARNKLTQSFDMFLGLLTTQLQNQDPLSPLDSEAFTNQLVQFSSVEQAIQTNKQLGDLMGMMRAGETAAALNYIGQNVVVEGDRITLGESGAEFGYTLDRNATSVTIQILDAAGRTTQLLNGPSTGGSHQVSWDGKDVSGNPAPEGMYQVLVSAVDKNNDPVSATTRINGRVDAVERDETGYLLHVGDQQVRADDVTLVRSAAAS